MSVPPRSVAYVDLDGGTWRWVRDFLESKKHSAISHLVSPETPADQVQYHRGVLAVCKEIVEFAEQGGQKGGGMVVRYKPLRKGKVRQQAGSDNHPGGPGRRLTFGSA